LLDSPGGIELQDEGEGDPVLDPNTGARSKMQRGRMNCNPDQKDAGLDCS
jgi:hypothetical protein